MSWVSCKLQKSKTEFDFKIVIPYTPHSMKELCRLTGDVCAVRELVDRREQLLGLASMVRDHIAKAREGGDVTDYTEMEKMRDNYLAMASRIGRDINKRACSICPFRTA